MSLRLKVFCVGTLVILLLCAAVFLFVPKEKHSAVLDEPLAPAQNATTSSAIP